MTSGRVKFKRTRPSFHTGIFKCCSTHPETWYLATWPQVYWYTIHIYIYAHETSEIYIFVINYREGVYWYFQRHQQYITTVDNGIQNLEKKKKKHYRKDTTNNMIRENVLQLARLPMHAWEKSSYLLQCANPTLATYTTAT
jgi:hypothetical protein